MKKSTKLKSLFGAFAFVLMMSGNKMAKADLIEDEEWITTGAPTYIEITEGEKIDGTPTEQDGEAVIVDVPKPTPRPTLAPTGIDYETYEPVPSDVHPSAGLEDEIDRKEGKPSPTPTNTPTPTTPIVKTGDDANTNGGSGAGLFVLGLGGLAAAGVYLSKVEAAKEYYRRNINKILDEESKKMH